MTRFIGLCSTVFAIVAVSASAASGDGLPVGNVDAGPSGVTNGAAQTRYVTLARGHDTLALAIRRNGGELSSSLQLHGRFTVPVVALDGTPGGLSADGRTLVLIKPRQAFPRDETAFAVIDSPRMRLRDVVRLRGDFSFDAISPDGRLLYLINYTSRRDATRYEVRAFDTTHGRLLPDPIVDPREPGEDMRGYPLTRATSPDGRWAYTLYDGAGKHPFVHALDTREMTAACIDLDGLAGRNDLQALRIGVKGDGASFSVLDGRRELFVVDADTFRVSTASAGGDKGGLTVLPAIALVALACLGGIALVLRQRRPASASSGRAA